MRFINDLVEAYPWATPAPIGYVELGWVPIVKELLESIDQSMSMAPGATLDILGLRELRGAIQMSWILDGGSDHTSVSIAEAVAMAEQRSSRTCPRCGHLRALRPRNALEVKRSVRDAAPV
jgi:hypothetical protein